MPQTQKHRFDAFAALFNVGSPTLYNTPFPFGPKNLTVTFADLYLPNPDRKDGFHVYDEWTQKDLGVHVSSFTALVPEHAVVFVRVYADT